MTNPTNEHREQAQGIDPRDNGCLCQLCGLRYKIDFILPDDLWSQVQAGLPHNFNLLCGTCIVSRLEKRGEFDYFDLVKTDVRDAEIREVLEGLMTRRWFGDKPTACWCDPRACPDSDDDEDQDARCRRTRALWAKLQPGKEGNDVEVR